MAVALRALRVKGAPGGITSTAIVVPAGTQAGDFLLLLGGSDTDTSQAAFVGPATEDGFEALTPWGGTAGGANLKQWTRWATAADVGKTYTLAVPSGSSQVFYLLAFTGVDTTSPIAAAPAPADGGSSAATALPAPSITPDVAAFGLFAWWTKGGGGTAQTITAPTATTSLSSSSSSGSDATGYTKSALAREDLDAQASGARTATLSGTARRWSAVSLALRPAFTTPTARSRAVGQPVETDTATSVGRSRRRTVGQPGEVDTVTAVDRVRVGRAGERDTVAAVDRTRRRGVGTVAEADTLTSPTRRRTRTPGQPRETDTITAIAARSRRRAVAQLGEVDTAAAVARRHRRPVGQVLEFDVVSQLGESSTSVTDAEYTRALTARRRRPFGTLRVDWSDTGTLPVSPADLGHLDDVVTSIEVTREQTGDLPEGAGEVDGFVSATLHATLGGRPARDPDAATVNAAARRLAETLSPFRVDSPLAGKRKTMHTAAVELGVITRAGPRSERVFTGPIRDLTIDEDGAIVELDAVDPSERMRSLVTLPNYGEFVTHVAERGRGNPAQGWQFTVNTQWVVDHASRRDGIFASPPFRNESIIGCTAHGGLVSEKGFNGAPISRVNAATRPASIHTQASNPWGMLASPEGSSGSYQEFYGVTDTVAPPVTFASGNGVGLSAWLHLSALAGSASTEYVLYQLWPTSTREPRLFVHGYGDGTIAAGLYDQNAYKIVTPRIPLGSTPWNFIGVHFRWIDDSTLGVVVRTRAWGSAAGTTRTYSLTGARVTVTPTAQYDGYRPILQCRAHFWRAWMLLQVWPGFTPPSTSSATPWRGEDHVSMADIGRGNNELVYLPDVAAQDGFEIRKAAIEAEYGVHGFSDYGRYYFRPRTDSREDRIDHVLDVAVNLAEVSYSVSSDTIRNSVGITTKPAYHVGKLETVVSADAVDQFIVPGNATRVFELDWPHGAAGWQGGVLPYCWQDSAEPANGIGFSKTISPKWGDVAHGWTYSSRGASGGWTINDNTRRVYVSYVQVDARKCRIRVRNTGSGEIRLATAATLDDPAGGEPALKIGGWPLKAAVDKVTTYRNEDSILDLGGQAGGGERSLPLASSEWRQHEPALSPVARALLAALSGETPLLADLPVRGDATIRVGEVAECRFRDDVSVVGTIVKTGHRLSLSDGRFSTSVTVRPLPVARQPLPAVGSDLAPAGWSFYIDISRYQEGIDLPRVREVGYAGLVAKIGQGASSAQGYGASIDPTWNDFRDEGRSIFPTTFAGYWYVGDSEAPADQAARCKAALGDLTIPVMLDWELGGGSWSNLLAVLSAFRQAGLLVTMLYTNLQGYAPSNGASNIDSATGGLALVNSRYWVSRTTNPAQDPRAVFDDILATNPTYGRGTILGGTVDALQFTDAGVVYPGGPAIDVNAFPGTQAQLAAMFGTTG